MHSSVSLVFLKAKDSTALWVHRPKTKETGPDALAEHHTRLCFKPYLQVDGGRGTGQTNTKANCCIYLMFTITVYYFRFFYTE